MSSDKESLPFVRFASRRSVVYGTHAMVASSQPLACQAGIEILRKGGNAADAAIATAAALNVTEPGSTGIGGDCFCLFYDSKTKTVKGLNGSGRSPAALTLEYVRDILSIHDRNIPYLNIHAVTVPGAAAGWVDTVESYGSGKLSIQEILQPAITLAEEGFPVSEISAWLWQRGENDIKSASPNANDMLLDGRAPKAGEFMRMPNLARTFRELAQHGKDGFYKGRIAQAVVDLIKDKGGVMTLDDLASHTSTFVNPISIEYRDLTVYECPPNGQGITALLALGILQSLQEQGKIPNISELEHNSAAYLHAVIESLRLAFADTNYYVADPKFYNLSLEQLLSKKYFDTRAQLFDPSKATIDPVKGSPVKSGDTVYFSVVDDEGNACSFINSNYMHFGTAAIPKDCGFTLHCRGAGFVLEEGHPNCLAPRKRPYHTIIPCMVTRDDELWLSFGVMGDYMQPQGHVQVILNLLHNDNFNVQNALDAPRVRVGPSGEKPIVFIEEGIDENVVRELVQMGHNVKIVKGWNRGIFGRGQIIEKRIAQNGKRIWAGGSDLRGDGHASGW
ncbi:2616_t:CDS:10 [Ambispora gerdemannii]|uniref:2616_t:CDS:1 n=1 Tax=Ambispora gerdemannii TaxID=144530 RepID=A0A9N9BHF9_9GLOM|nr:2616_t:CDS:10 [Ambispora gerdemannii]